jgi:hypothetical protein
VSSGSNRIEPPASTIRTSSVLEGGTSGVRFEAIATATPPNPRTAVVASATAILFVTIGSWRRGGEVSERHEGIPSGGADLSGNRRKGCGGSDGTGCGETPDAEGVREVAPVPGIGGTPEPEAHGPDRTSAPVLAQLRPVGYIRSRRNSGVHLAIVAERTVNDPVISRIPTRMSRAPLARLTQGR